MLQRISAFLLFATPIAAQTSSLFGTVRDSAGAGVANARVAAPKLSIAVATDSLGIYELTGLTAAVHLIVVSRPGFVTDSIELAFAPDKAYRRVFTLVPSVAALDPVETKAEATVAVPMHVRAFEDRRSKGIGNYWTAEDFEKQKSRKLADFIARVPGVRIARGRSGEAWVERGRGPAGFRPGQRPGMVDETQGATQSCFAVVYVDGTVMYSGRSGEPLFNINDLDLGNLAGVEYYASASTIPPDFNGPRSACGALAIWTKRGRGQK
jgi:hypothetical protein